MATSVYMNLLNFIKCLCSLPTVSPDGSSINFYIRQVSLKFN
nr:MAG TPA: hypothetical protein [Caudoviricetes sp.]